MSNWYADSRAKVASVYGDDADLYTGLLAATSPHTTLKANVKLASKAYHQVKRGDVIVGFLPVHKANIERVRDGKPLTGQKVRAFHANLTGDEYQVTIDIWMARHFGHGDKSITPKKYTEFSLRVANEAQDQGITPAQLQADIWIKARGGADSYSRYIEGKQLAMEIK